jgi:hypothetical protein
MKELMPKPVAALFAAGIVSICSISYAASGCVFAARLTLRRGGSSRPGGLIPSASLADQLPVKQPRKEG